jgi:putative membrane protein
MALLRKVAGALLWITVPTLALAQPPERYWGPGMMWDGGGIFQMFFGFLMMLLFLGAIMVLVVLAVRWLGGSGHHLLGGPPGQGQTRALDLLKERLARGEIDVAEFEERKRALGE